MEIIGKKFLRRFERDVIFNSIFMKKLNIPLVFQDKNSVDCGLACLQMVFEYYGEKRTIAEMKKELKLYKIGTYSPQLGAYLLKNGFKVELITQHPGLFTLRHRKVGQKGLLEHIKNLYAENKDEKHAITLKYFLEFMEAGGMIKVKVPGAGDIKNALNKNRPLIALITQGFLLDKEPNFNFHFNVVTGVSGDSVYLNDPDSDHEGKQKYSMTDFLYALHSSVHGDLDNGSLLVIRR